MWAKAARARVAPVAAVAVVAAESALHMLDSRVKSTTIRDDFFE